MREPVLCLLGAPRFVGPEGERRFKPDRPCQLLFYLALRADWVTRDALAELLFAGRSTASARANLRTVLHRAQRFDLATNTLESNGELLRWLVATDVREFEAALNEGRVTDAVGGYAAPLGTGLDDPGNAPFTEWLASERARLAARWHAAALSVLAQLAPEGVIALSERLLAADPLDEDALVARLAALVALGRDGAARKEYAAFREQLAESLGIEPSARVREFDQRLHRVVPHTGVPPVSAPATATATALIGRATELTELRELLANDACRRLTVTGPGGVGKSRLAHAAFETLQPAFPDGRWWIDLDDLTEVGRVGLRVLDVLAVEILDDADPEALIVARLRDLRALLVFDNCEHLEGFGLWLERLCATSPKLKILSTSRTRLSLAGEWVLPIEGLPVPDADETELDALQSFDAVKFFDLCARRALASFALTAHASEVAQLVRAIEGMPLAIELAAAWVRLLPVAEILREVARSLDLLATPAARSDRHRSVRASFEHSWQMLAPAERRALPALTVLRGSFARHAAAYVAGASLPLLAALVDKSLVRADGSGRFSLHVLISQCAAERLDDIEACRRRHAEHYGQLLARYANYARVDHKLALQEIVADLENCRAAWHWAIEHRDGAFVERTALAVMYFFEAIGRWREGIELLEGAAHVFDERTAAGRPALAVVWRALATLHYRRGDVVSAEQRARDGLRLNRLLRHRAGVKSCLNTIGLALWRRDRLDEAIRFFEQALKLALADNDENGIATFNSGIAMCEKARGAYERALPRYEQALAIWRKQGDQLGLANALNNLGNVHRACERWEAAMRYFDEGLAVCDAHGFASTRPFLLINQAITCLELKQIERSHRLSLQARTEAHEHGEPYAEAAALLNLAQIALLRGEAGAAGELLRPALRMAHSSDDPSSLAEAFNVAGDWLLASADPAAARKLWEFVAHHPQVAEDERARARKRLALHGSAETAASEGMPPLASIDVVIDDLFARFDAARAASPAVPTVPKQ